MKMHFGSSCDMYHNINRNFVLSIGKYVQIIKCKPKLNRASTAMFRQSNMPGPFSFCFLNLLLNYLVNKQKISNMPTFLNLQDYNSILSSTLIVNF